MVVRLINVLHKCVLMYVRKCVRTCIYAYACAGSCMRARVRVFANESAHVCVHIKVGRMQVCALTYACARATVCVHVCVRACECVYY
jgi:hypothetical protein